MTVANVLVVNAVFVVLTDFAVVNFVSLVFVDTPQFESNLSIPYGSKALFFCWNKKSELLRIISMPATP